MGVYLTGVHLTGVYGMGVHLTTRTTQKAGAEGI
jgi:hypothetical protein